VRGKDPPKAAGFLRQNEGGMLMGEIDPAALAPGPPDAFAVSLEPEGGSPSPTAEQILVLGKIKG
jgi:anti-sigma-K factor RskA